MNLNRVFHLVKREIGLNLNTYITWLLVITVLQSLAPQNFYVFWFILVLPLGFKEYNGNPGQLIQFMTLPTSNAERYTSSLILNFIVFPLMALIPAIVGYYINELLANSVFNFSLSPNKGLIASVFGSSELNKGVALFFTFLFLYSMAFFGNIYLKKHGGIKVLAGFVGFGIFITVLLVRLLINAEDGLRLSMAFRYTDIPIYIGYLINIGSVLFFMVLAYIALKEKEA